jgi:hypothetical protein
MACNISEKRRAGIHEVALLCLPPKTWPYLPSRLQRAVRGPLGTILTEATGREMVVPVGVGPYAMGFEISKRGEGLYLEIEATIILIGN